VCRSLLLVVFCFSSSRRHTRFSRDWSSDVCSSDLSPYQAARARVLLGLAHRSLGDADGAATSFAAARDAFKKLDAAPDLESLLVLGNPDAPFGLTARERQVLTGLAAGETNRSIGDRLGISDRTVDRHVSNVFDKLGVTSRAEAAALAVRHHLV